jgi:hypothetical protein
MRTLTGEFVAIQDADLECDPSDLHALIAPLASGESDVVYRLRQHDSAARGVNGWCGWDRTACRGPA